MTDSPPLADSRALDAVADALRAAVRDVPDFPSPGILFKDITPLLADPRLFVAAAQAMAAPFRDDAVTHVLGIESRGFIFGGAVAVELGAGFVPARKAGKLPARTETVSYALEYGSATLEVHADAFPAGARVLVVDDVIATGGTAAAACELVERLQSTVVGCTFLISLSFLTRSDALAGRRAASVLVY